MQELKRAIYANLAVNAVIIYLTCNAQAHWEAWAVSRRSSAAPCSVYLYICS